MFLKIKNIPSVSWSSEKPLNFKPKISTFFFLCFGLTLFGLGEGLLIVSASGASPWSVLAQGLYLNLGFSVGVITIFISFIAVYLRFLAFLYLVPLDIFVIDSYDGLSRLKNEKKFLSILDKNSILADGRSIISFKTESFSQW